MSEDRDHKDRLKEALDRELDEDKGIIIRRIGDGEVKFADSAFRHGDDESEVPDGSVLGQLIDLQSDIACGMADCGHPTAITRKGDIVMRLQKIIDFVRDQDANFGQKGNQLKDWLAEGVDIDE